MDFSFLSNSREDKKRPAGATLGAFWISKIVLELFHTMESRQQASLPGHDVAATTDAGCSTDAAQSHTSHHVDLL